MKRINTCIITALAFALTGVTATAQTETTFTYQGELHDSGELANGLFDMEYSLWDSPSEGNQIGTTIVMNGLPVTDGRFTVNLDFGAAAFDNTGRWLEIAVEGVYLAPRQPITRAPYSIQTRGILVDENSRIGIGTTSPQDAVHVYGSPPTLRLEHAVGDSHSEIKDGTTQQLRINKVNNAGGVLLDLNPKATNGTSNAQVRFFRETDTTGPKYVQFLRGNFSTSESARIGVDGANSCFQAHGGNFGIRTNSPDANLHINGDESSAVGFRIDQPRSSTGYIAMGSPLGHTAIAAAANRER